MDYESLTVRELKSKCRERGLTRYSRLRRDELLRYLQTGQYPRADSDVGTPSLRPASSATGTEGNEKKSSRREFLAATAKWTAVTTGAGVISAYVQQPATRVWEGTVELAEHMLNTGERALLKGLVDVTEKIQFITGETNRLGSLEGKKGPSPYVRGACMKFSAFVKEHSDSSGGEVVQRNPDDPVLQLDERNNDLVLIGGPVSNYLYARISGHNFKDVHRDGRRIKMPAFNRMSGLRWGFWVGADGYGRHVGCEKLVRRYDQGLEVRRPLYGMVDAEQKDPMMMGVARNGFLCEDALLLTHVPNPPARSVLLIGGVHGYSVFAFGRDLIKNLEELQSLRGDAQWFQAMVPAVLEHDHTFRRTTARLDWKRAHIQTLPADYRHRPFALAKATSP